MRLVEARVDTYAALFSPPWDRTAPSLDAYLGDARWLLDLNFNRLDSGTEALGPIKWMEPVNWKTAVDNCSDNYHVPTTHLSTIIVQGRHRGIPRLTHEQQFQSENKHLFVNGHSLTMRFLERPDQARQNHGVTAENREAFEEYYRQTLAESERRLGSLRARRLQLGTTACSQRRAGASISPPPRPAANRVLALRGAGEGYARGTEDRPAPGQRQLQRRQRHLRAGRYGQLARVTNSALTAMGRKYAQDLSMGVGHDRRHPRLSPALSRNATPGKQPAPVLSPLGAVYERRELGGHPAGAEGNGLRRHGDPARLGANNGD